MCDRSYAQGAIDRIQKFERIFWLLPIKVDFLAKI